MTKSSKTTEPRSKAGFVLLETLVALAAAAIFLPVAAAGFSMAWGGSRIVEETVEGLSIARSLAAELRAGQISYPRSGAIGGFAFSIAAEPLWIEPRPSSLAPPLPSSPQPAAAQPQATRPLAAKSTPTQKFLRIAITVTAPSGRKIQMETGGIQIETGKTQITAK